MSLNFKINLQVSPNQNTDAKCTDFSSRDRRGSLESKFHSLIRLNLSIRCQLNPPITETGIYVVFFNKFRLDFAVKKYVVSYT